MARTNSIASPPRHTARPTPEAPSPKPQALAHRVHHQIDRKPRIVFPPKAFIPPVIIPLAAIILVRVENAQPAAPLQAAQVIVDDVVSPAIQLVTRLRGTFRKAEEGPIDRMRVRDLRQRIVARENARDLGLE